MNKYSDNFITYNEKSIIKSNHNIIEHLTNGNEELEEEEEEYDDNEESSESNELEEEKEEESSESNELEEEKEEEDDDNEEPDDSELKSGTILKKKIPDIFLPIYIAIYTLLFLGFIYILFFTSGGKVKGELTGNLGTVTNMTAAIGGIKTKISLVFGTLSIIGLFIATIVLFNKKIPKYIKVKGKVIKSETKTITTTDNEQNTTTRNTYKLDVKYKDMENNILNGIIPDSNTNFNIHDYIDLEYPENNSASVQICCYTPVETIGMYITSGISIFLLLSLIVLGLFRNNRLLNTASGVGTVAKSIKGEL